MEEETQRKERQGEKSNTSRKLQLPNNFKKTVITILRKIREDIAATRERHFQKVFSENK